GVTLDPQTLPHTGWQVASLSAAARLGRDLRATVLPALHKTDVALGGAFDGVFAAGSHLAAIPRAIDALERERPHAVGDATHRVRRQRNQVWVAVHEAQKAAIHDYGERVAAQQKPLSLVAVGPVQRGRAVEVAAGVDQR